MFSKWCMKLTFCYASLPHLDLCNLDGNLIGYSISWLLIFELLGQNQAENWKLEL